MTIDDVVPVSMIHHADVQTPATDRRRMLELGTIIGGYLLAAIMVWSMFSGYLIDEGVGVVALVLMLLLVMLQVQVAAAMLLAAILGMWAARGSRAAVNLVTGLPFDAVASWSLAVLPMFIFMGLLLWQSGVTTRLYYAGREWLSWLPGGLAIGTNAAGAGMAAISGSTIGSSYALGRIGIPEMLKAGYHPRLVIASIMSAGLPGQLIPPSILMVVYAGIAEVPVGPQLMAGIGPGFLVLGMYCLATLGLAIAKPEWAGRNRESDGLPTSTWRTKIVSLRGIWLAPTLIFVVVGGIFSGIVTANESAAVAGLIALVATVLYRLRSGPMSALKKAVAGAIEAVGAVFLVIVAAHAVGSMLAITGLGAAFTSWVTGLGLSQATFLIVLFFGYLVLGTFIEPLPMMLMTVPLLMPALDQMDVSLLWFGVFVVFMGELAILSPPVGILLYVIANLTKEPDVNVGVRITMRDCLVAQLWLWPVAFVVVLVLIFVPEVATALPGLTGD